MFSSFLTKLVGDFIPINFSKIAKNVFSPRQNMDSWPSMLVACLCAYVRNPSVFLGYRVSSQEHVMSNQLFVHFPNLIQNGFQSYTESHLASRSNDLQALH